MDRRNFILKSSLILAGSSFYGFKSNNDSPVLRFGMVADPHYAEVDPSGRSDRYYRQSAKKMETAIAHFNT